jgi:iron complex transport system substrate-binding protein
VKRRRSKDSTPAGRIGPAFVLLAAAVLAIAGCKGTGSHAAGHGEAHFQPERIISLTVASDEILWRLGPTVRTRVIGVSALADDPLYSGIVGQWPEDLPRLLGTSEQVVAGAPDLVIAASFTAPETRGQIAAAGISLVSLVNLAGFEDYRTNVRTIAQAVAAEPLGDTLIADFDRRMTEARADPPVQQPTAVSWIGDMVAGSNTSFDDIARAAGCTNVAAEHGIVGHQAVGLEQIVVWDPEVIVTECGARPCALAEAALARKPGLARRSTPNLEPSAAQRRIVALPSHMLYSTGEGMLDAVARLRQALR